MSSIEARGLARTFVSRRSVAAVRGVDLQVEHGEIVRPGERLSAATALWVRVTSGSVDDYAPFS